MVNDAPIPGGPRAGSLTCAAPAQGVLLDRPRVRGSPGGECSPGAPRTYPDLVDSLFSDLQTVPSTSARAVRTNHEPRRRGVVERLFEGWTKEGPGHCGWPM